MNKIINISVGIPAYNEAANIAKLLRSVLAQKEDGFRLHEIIVACDGSTDGTDLQVKATKDKRVRLVNDGKRMGKSARMNQILKAFRGDVLIFLDADIAIDDRRLFAKMLASSNLQKDGLLAIDARPFPARSFFEHIVEIGVFVMKEIAKKWRNGNNYLSFKGCFLVLDRQFAKSIALHPLVINNDAYLYFAARKKRFIPRYLSDLQVYFKSPKTFEDHVKQASRYQGSREEMERYFDFDWDEEYTIPRLLLIKSSIKQLFLQPVFFLCYVFMQLFIKSKKETTMSGLWEMAVSTK